MKTHQNQLDFLFTHRIRHRNTLKNTTSRQKCFDYEATWFDIVAGAQCLLLW